MLMLALESALRSIQRSPWVCALIALAIALGVGVTMPMVALYHNTSGNPIPDRSDNLYIMLLDNWDAEQGPWFNNPDLPPDFMTARDARALAASDLSSGVTVSYISLQSILSADEEVGVEPFHAEVRVTGRDFFDMFGVPIEYGAIWSEADEKAVQNVAVISYSTNQRLFGGGDNVGRNFKIGANIYTIVGIMPTWSLTPRIYAMGNNARTEGVFVPLSDFRRSAIIPSQTASLEISTPEVFDEAFLASETLFATLWLKLDSAQAVMDYRDFVDGYVAEQKSLGRFAKEKMNNQLHSATSWLEISPNNEGTKRLYTVFIVIGIFFLLVCLLNLLNLLLGKFMASLPETSITRALGAPRVLIFFQYVFEVMILGAIGGLLSIWISKSVLSAMLWVYLENLPPEFKEVQSQVGTSTAYIQFDAYLLTITLIVALVASFLAALYPAIKACRMQPAEYLKIN